MKKILQQPLWPNQEQYLKIINKIKNYPQLVYPNEINNLKSELKDVARGKKFIIQGGDCAETFKNFSEDMIKNKLKILLQMSAIIKYSTSLKTICSLEKAMTWSRILNASRMLPSDFLAIASTEALSDCNSSLLIILFIVLN